MASYQPAVFLDRDGVLIDLVERADSYDSAKRPEEVRLAGGVAAGMRILAALPFKLIVVSNQPGIAKATMTSDDLNAVTKEFLCQLLDAGAWVDAIYYCIHHPQAAAPHLRAACPCRKPAPGMLTTAASDHRLSLAKSYMIGDHPKDITAGQAAGCTTIGIRGSYPFDPANPPAIAFDSLLDAARWIASREEPRRHVTAKPGSDRLGAA